MTECKQQKLEFQDISGKRVEGRFDAGRLSSDGGLLLIRQLVEGQRLEQVWEERFQPEFGVLREVLTETLDEYLNCGILAHGFARAECDGCGHSIAVAFSCKKRGVCPSCAAKRAVIFAEHMESEVLEKVPHRHLVLSLPKRLRAFFRYDRRLLSILFTAAW